MNLKGKLRFVGLTDTGRVREHNEDTIALDQDLGLLVLADGMGGYNAGEVASGIAVKTIVNLVKEALAREDLLEGDPGSGESRTAIILRDAIARANKIIFQTAHTQAQCEGMGTTIVAALLHDNRITIAHVGTRACIGCEMAISSRSPSIIHCFRNWLIAAFTPRKRPSGRPIRTMSPAPLGSRRAWMWKFRNIRPSAGISTCCARTASQIWSKMMIFI
jgi:hypothetical protein